MSNETANPPVAFNPALDLQGLRERFDATGRVQVKDAFSDDTAGRLHQCLSQETPWMLAFNEGETPRYLSRQEMDEMSDAQKANMMQNIFSNASKQFQYAYSDFPVSGTINDPNQPNQYTHDVLRFLNGQTFQDMIKKVTGLEGKFAVDGHATCFQSGHFLTIHNDTDADDRREIAYVINMTPTWRSDWGAHLMFYDDEFNIVETFAPKYNTINMFRIPQAHAVSFVPPFCPQKRFGMTGWFHRFED